LALGIVSAGTGLGTVILSPVSSYLIATHGWSISYFILGIVAGIAFIAPAQFPRREPQKAVAGALRTISSTPQTSPDEFTLKQALRTRHLWLIYLMYFLCWTCIFAVMGHLVRHAEDMNISRTVAATFLSVVGASGIAGRIAMGSISDRIGRKISLIICLILVGGIMFWLTTIESVWTFYFFSAIFGFCYGGIVTVVAATVGRLFWFTAYGGNLWLGGNTCRLWWCR